MSGPVSFWEVVSRAQELGCKALSLLAESCTADKFPLWAGAAMHYRLKATSAERGLNTDAL